MLTSYYTSVTLFLHILWILSHSMPKTPLVEHVSLFDISKFFSCKVYKCNGFRQGIMKWALLYLHVFLRGFFALLIPTFYYFLLFWLGFSSIYKEQNYVFPPTIEWVLLLMNTIFYITFLKSNNMERALLFPTFQSLFYTYVISQANYLLKKEILLHNPFKCQRVHKKSTCPLSGGGGGWGSNPRPP